MNSPLFRFSVFYAIGGLALIGFSAYLADMPTARSVAIVWALVGVPLVLIVLGRMNRDTSDGAALMHLVGLALLAILTAVGIFRLWPLLPEIIDSMSQLF